MKINIPHPQPLVSVLLPTYNSGPYLRPALLSILRQTYSYLEVIIINDGSTDGSLATIKDIKDNRITLIHQENSGKAVALNKALDIVTGQYWLIQDGDDLSYPDRVLILLKELSDNQEIAAVFSGHDLLVQNKQFAPTFSSKSVEQCNYEIDNFRIPAHDATGLYRTSQVGGLRFDPELRVGQGIDFLFKVGELFPVYRLNQCLYTYRINYQSTIRKKPSHNIKWVNLVIQKACTRRDKDYNRYRLQAKTLSSKQAKSKLNHIVPHCMESVIDLKRSGKLIKSIQTGLICFKIAPNHLSFYKPLIYAFLPVVLIDQYRRIKGSSGKRVLVRNE